MNESVLDLFRDFEIGGASIPVAFQRYDGHGEPYVTFVRESDEEALSCDDRLECLVTYYDFDIYSRSNYIALADAVRQKLESAGWTWQPDRSSGDLYESATGYHHVTLSFAIERSV